MTRPFSIRNALGRPRAIFAVQENLFAPLDLSRLRGQISAKVRTDYYLHGEMVEWAAMASENIRQRT